ncbi:MAG TPA: ATP-binding protein [Amaricoccus sp.]|uniref:ATP-binding protein n=1 Tax=Amaricoccus sp. TaxID=1872485 RepID=UPI001DBD3B49|nr:ATP-binding protein [Amaricoccus sp.]MCB1370911.1 two-component sensor histidine kinase [Paracoccaceae bacterium]MCB1373139.1 two-component sensor histidine kinase [Paracoccaceae bacterium]MCB1401435.1 two-component sensor histidine kinase [Paracoccaceae bacterium]HPG21158.1 ATP-binding protein [Amaricoccus sp.]HRW14639.1 ATP-binding protein [Amaricoccus sp.]
MPAHPVKSLLPRSLFGRAVAILLVPIVLLQLVVGLVFFQRHYQRVTEQMSEIAARELRQAIGVAERAGAPAEAAARLAALSGPLDLPLTLHPGEILEPGIDRPPFDATGRTLAETLQSAIPRPMTIDLRSDPGTALIAIQTAPGVIETAVPRSRLTVTNPHQLLVLMIAAALLLSAIAVVFLRNQVRPIRRLAEAADAFGKGRALPFRPGGAEEVRRAGAAFLAMRGRIERQIEQRTQMLTGVSHDLRTPLTRMKLTLALMEETEETRDLARDAAQMERMLGEFLAFARGDPAEPTTPVDPFALAAGIVEDARRTGTRIELVTETDTPEAPLVELRAGAVTRAVDNLVGNAARHGRRVRLTVRLLPRTLVISVEDDGPGIPAQDRMRAMQPFTRLEEARNQDEGGHVGLGLSIAMDVARAHGGGLELGDSADLGGLRAILRLPR